MGLRCHTCGGEVADTSPALIGMLIVRAASLGSQLVEARAQVIVLRNRVTGKQVGKKTPEHVRAQRERDLAQLRSLEESIPRLEGTSAGMGFRIMELVRERQGRTKQRE